MAIYRDSGHFVYAAHDGSLGASAYAQSNKIYTGPFSPGTVVATIGKPMEFSTTNGFSTSYPDFKGEFYQSNAIPLDITRIRGGITIAAPTMITYSFRVYRGQSAMSDFTRTTQIYKQGSYAGSTTITKAQLASGQPFLIAPGRDSSGMTDLHGLVSGGSLYVYYGKDSATATKAGSNYNSSLVYWSVVGFDTYASKHYGFLIIDKITAY